MNKKKVKKIRILIFLAPGVFNIDIAIHLKSTSES